MYYYYKQKFLTWYVYGGLLQFMLGNELFIQPEFEGDAYPYLSKVLFTVFWLEIVAIIILIVNIIISYL